VNSLRGVAILGVIFCHLFYMSFQPGWILKSHPGAAWMPLGAAVTNTWLAVNLFFILSGFVLYLPYARSERPLAARADYLGFYRHRLRRLAPLFLVNVAIALLLTNHVFNARFLAEVTVMFSGTFVFFPDWYIPGANIVLWSLGLELCFSVLFVPLVLVIRRFGLARTLAVVFALALATRLVGALTLPPIWHFNFYLNIIKDSILGRLDDFLVGMALASIYARRAPGGSRLRSLLTGGAGVALALAGMVLWDLRILGKIPLWVAAFINLPVSLGFGLVVVGAIDLGAASGALIRAVLRAYPLQLIGMMSYSLYVWHNLAIRGVLGEHREAPALAAFSILLLLAAGASYRFIEFGHVRNARDLLPR
jgi:peptidoglycan/LPS O-acetylase OafA/YrhL